MRDQFYLILPSNSSMKFHPENTITHFVTQLPDSMKLPGEWVVALTEIQFPRSFMHFTDADTGTLVLNSGRGAAFTNSRIPRGIYSSVRALINKIYTDPLFDDHIRINYNEDNGGIVSLDRHPDSCVANDCSLPHLVFFSDKISRVLGFETNESKNIDNGQVFTANFPASLSHAIPDKLFVYTDICENYITGDVQTPLLRIVPIENTNYTYGSIQTKSFSPPIYIPLLRTEFNTIEIDIRTHTGDPVPFESGTLTVTLHFKRIR